MAGEEYTGGSRSCATGTAADAQERVPPKGAAGDLADARERVPPVVADAADARERVPPAIREMTGNEICYLPSVEIQQSPTVEIADDRNLFCHRCITAEEIAVLAIDHCVMGSKISVGIRKMSIQKLVKIYGIIHI